VNGYFSAKSVLERVVSAVVVTRESRIDAESWALHPEEEPYGIDAGEVRRREFAAGRTLARRALASLQVPPGPVLRNTQRVPLWPPGTTGSISHTASWCGVAVARTSALRSIGIDGEHPIEHRVRESVLELICRPAERDFVHRSAGERQRSVRAALLFSAKESLHKCRFPHQREFLEFTDVEVEVDLASGSFIARLANLSPSSAEPPVWPGRFAIGRDLVVTAVEWPA